MIEAIMFSCLDGVSITQAIAAQRSNARTRPLLLQETIMQALSPQRCSRFFVMILVAWAVAWGAPLTAANPQDPAPSTEVPLVWQGESYLCYPDNPKSEEAQEDNTTRLGQQVFQDFKNPPRCGPRNCVAMCVTCEYDICRIHGGSISACKAEMEVCKADCNEPQECRPGDPCDT
jgi:hypothetical protein